jgi:FkbM family methyltransferase
MPAILRQVVFQRMVLHEPLNLVVISFSFATDTSIMHASRSLTRALSLFRTEGLIGVGQRVGRTTLGRRVQRWNRLSKRDLVRGRQRLRVGRYLLDVPADLAWAFPDGRYYERNVEYWFRHAVAERSAPVVYDVGANCGYYVLVAAERARRVYAFEPASPSRRLLTGTVVRNKLDNVEILPCAVGEGPDNASITLYNSSGNNGIVARNSESIKHLEVIGQEQVPVVTLDSLMADQALLPPDVIKMDIEGSELAALRGAREVLRTYHPLLIVEHDEAIARDAGYSLFALRDELESLGYRVRGLRRDEYGVHEQDVVLYDLDELPPDELGTVVSIATQSSN